MRVRLRVTFSVLRCKILLLFVQTAMYSTMMAQMDILFTLFFCNESCEMFESNPLDCNSSHLSPL